MHLGGGEESPSSVLQGKGIPLLGVSPVGPYTPGRYPTFPRMFRLSARGYPEVGYRWSSMIRNTHLFIIIVVKVLLS